MHYLNLTCVWFCHGSFGPNLTYSHFDDLIGQILVLPTPEQDKYGGQGDDDHSGTGTAQAQADDQGDTLYVDHGHHLGKGNRTG